MVKKNDNNDPENKDSGNGENQNSEDSNQDAGAGKKTENGDGDKPLTKADIQTIVSEAITTAVKDVITPEIDRRISGASKTIYKKVGTKEDSDDSKKTDAGAEAEKQAKLKDRLEMISVYAETTVKEELGKLDEDDQELVDTLIASELSRMEFEDGQTVKEIAKIVGTSVTKKVLKLRENVKGKTIDALKKAGQVIEVAEPGRTDSKVNDFDQGKKIAEQRHPAKKAS